MIPKTIHYAWFGGKPLPPNVIKCIESWKKYCPDYEIKRWDESNYDFNKHHYPREAYAQEKYAFAVDYLRLEVLYKFGGIFFDTDVEVIKNIDPLLIYPCFAGFEHGEFNNLPVNAGIGMGAEAGNPVVKAMLEDYNHHFFIGTDGVLNMTPCPAYQTEVLLHFGLKPENRKQNLGDIIVFPTDYFCPKDYCTSKISITQNTYSIHHYSATWMPGYRRVWHLLTQKIPPLRTFDKVRKKIMGKGEHI